MAVQLVSAEFPSGSVSSKLPVVEIENKDIKAPDYLKGRITGRTSGVFTSDEQQRKIVWESNYKRRQSQLTEGGFHCSPGHKYTEIGDVILDDSTLILQALGQDKKLLTGSSQASSAGSRGVKRSPPVLRSRTPSQFPDQLRKLDTELQHSNSYLNKIRKGQGLFQLIREEAEVERKKAETKILLEKEQNDLEWKEATSSDIAITQASDGSAEDEIDNDSEVLETHRFLCVMLWILDCMKLESPQYMPALSTYFRINRPQASSGKRIYERQVVLLNKWEEIATHNRPIAQKITRKKEQKDKPRPLSHLEKAKAEETKLRGQRNLTPEQIEKLRITVDEELNKSKKKAQLKIKELMQQSALKYRVNKLSSQKKQFVPVIGLDVKHSQDLFEKVDESHEMIVHEQLSAMSRDRQDALEQRFSSLRMSGNMWSDISNMRKGVEIESTTMAQNKLMMNYDWISDLGRSLSEEALENRYCREVFSRLAELQQYMKSVGPHVMSQNKLIEVLATLYPWQLDSPEVTRAIEFIIKNVIYTVQEDYQKWTEYHRFNEKK